MELLGLLLILTAIADRVGRAIAWCLVALTKGFCLLLVAVVRLIIATISDRHEARRQETIGNPNTTVNPNIDDAVEGLKKLGVPIGAGKRYVEKAAERLGPRATLAELIKTALQSMEAPRPAG